MIRIIRAIVKKSIEEFMIYKNTSIIIFILALAFFVIELITGTIYFNDGRAIEGWSRNDYFIMISSVSCSTYIYNIFFITGHETLSENILEGELDYILIRPGSSYWYSAFNGIDIPSIFNFICSYILLLIFLNNASASLAQILFVSLMILISAFLIFTLNQIVLSALFWFNGLTALGGIVEDFVGFMSRPKSIFPIIVQNLFLFIFPILLTTNISIEFLKHNFNFYFYYFLVITVILFCLSKFIWKLGLKHYTSAN